MDKFLRPDRLEADPNSSGAATEWKHWYRTFNNFLEAIQSHKPDKLKTLVNYVAPRVYEYIADCDEYDSAITTLEKMYVKPKNEVFARHLLSTRKQQTSESLDEFLQALKQLSGDCNFKAVTAEKYKEEAVRDAFISGLRSSVIRQHLLENKTLQLQDAFDQALALDVAQKSSDSYASVIPSFSAATDVSEETPAAVATVRVQNNSKCFFCGNNRHPRVVCPARDILCNKCSKKGHFAKMCRSSTSAAVTTYSPMLATALAASLDSLSKAVMKVSINVVIEEAAEILESHVITSLTANCQHLIMIGDHQQLQPSATVYELATKYGLETSLFERMIKNGLAFETLEYQHRMRPEISQLLVPSIYPTLKDHPSVQDYPRVLGMVHNVFFLSHQEHERAESDDNNSHENQHEAELIMGLCRHLMLQGYSPQEVTILTTYSGQFFLLRKLQRQYPECTGVRIAVVDNFQGEENKIILLSLVRSNPEGNAGFLRRDNRVCVALSRAKHGLYITGNMGLLSESSSLWKKISGDLVQCGSLGLAFTLRCENHPDQVVTVATGADFLAKSPEGVCVQVCAKPLPNCRHPCPRVCHMDDPEHKEYKCRVPCPKTLCSLDHKCPKLCHEICGPCMVILPKPLPCGRTHRIPCHVAPESHECPTMVEKKIPACEHVVTMPCHHNPSTFTCPEDCDTRVPCGHKCRKKCHRTKDPDHLEYSCQEACTKINVGCTQKHPCLKKCYEECGACVVKVDKKLPCGHEQKDVECSQPVGEIQCKKYCKKTLPCGHEQKDVECSQPAEEILCLKDCKKTLLCGHKCKRLCFKECGDCQVPVKKVVQACSHSIITACSDPATTDKCDGPCPKTLPCGHPCRAKCKDACTPKCPELVYSADTCPKGHVIELPCHLNTKVVGEAAWGFCNAPCDKKLDCGHQCVGTCGRCLHGRLHLDCNKPCKRPLVCGHICKYPCSATCPPCQEKCQWKCSHSQCRQLCGRLCQPCKEMCEVGCKHKKCTKRCGDSCKWRCKQHKEGDGECGEDCSRKPCQEPCKEKLKCGHECVGFCGDPCPPLCRECDHDELTEFVLLGNEDEPDARFVWLEDCGHCIEVEGLEGWLQREDTAVGMKTCPRCRTTIYNNRRYQNIVLQTYKAVLAIKKKYYQPQNSIKTRDIELILQGESQTSFAYQFRVSQNLISSIIPEVCQAIYNALQPLYVVVPGTEEKWKEVAQGFNTLWNFPLCVGALDGKRVLIQKPANSGSLYFDYKGDFSIILMALVDSDYKFLYIDVGTNGRGSDAGVWSRCSLSAGLENNSVSLPPPEFLPNSSTESPYVIVGDDAFPLKTYLMKPYPGLDQPDEKRIFNYRLSRARRVSENAFGILVSRFQIFRQPIRTSPECVTKIVLASVALHNYLRVTSRDAYAPADGNENTSSGHHRGVAGGLQNFQAVPRRPARDAVQVRQKLMAYFNSVGTVPWQREMAHLH